MRRIFRSGNTCISNFNPRTHVGCDFWFSVNCNITLNFNPRTHVGCDTSVPAGDSASVDFNPRTHVGCDMTAKFNLLASNDFNPRTHVGCDRIKFMQQLCNSISIHAPTWGATLYYIFFFNLVKISIHAPTWGATQLRFLLIQIYLNFNPRTHVGCDTEIAKTALTEADFNPRTHVGCD